MKKQEIKSAIFDQIQIQHDTRYSKYEQNKARAKEERLRNFLSKKFGEYYTHK